METTSTRAMLVERPELGEDDAITATIPRSEIVAIPSLRQASFQSIFASPLTRTFPPLSESSSGLAFREGATLAKSAWAGLPTASLTPETSALSQHPRTGSFLTCDYMVT